MRHGDKVNNLGRKKAHRKALLQNLANDLITHKRIITTLAKAKALKQFIEPLMTKSKTNTTHQHRIVFSYLQNKATTNELFNSISNKISERNGGYSRIIKLGSRKGDAAELAMIELVDYNTTYSNKATTKEQTAKRTRRSSRKKTATTTPQKFSTQDQPSTKKTSNKSSKEKDDTTLKTKSSEVENTPSKDKENKD